VAFDPTIHLWRFKQDFEEIKDVLNDYLADLRNVSWNVPKDTGRDDLAVLLRRTDIELGNHAARITDAPLAPAEPIADWKQPKLIVEIIKYDAMEVINTSASDLARMSFFQQVNAASANGVIVSVLLTVRNEHQTDSKVYGWGLSLYDSHHNGRLVASGVAKDIAPNLLESVRYTSPVTGWVQFWIAATDAQSVANRHFVISIIDGLKVSSATPPLLMPRIKQPSEPEDQSGQQSPESTKHENSSQFTLPE
jgi:hypothetical protein